jgi:hypothetical protein
MSAKALFATASLAGLALIAAIRLWPAAPDRSAAGPQTSLPNVSWSRAAALDTSRGAPPLSAADPLTDDEKYSESLGSTASYSVSPPQAQAVTMQDGTVLWVAGRERAASAPARER